MPKQSARSKRDVFDACDDEFKVVGKLSSLFPSYVRQCCRSRFDGTDIYTLEANRTIARKMLMPYVNDYTFAVAHLELFDKWYPPVVLDLIRSMVDLPTKGDVCPATMAGTSPKKACLHCPRVGMFMDAMTEQPINPT